MFVMIGVAAGLAATEQSAAVMPFRSDTVQPATVAVLDRLFLATIAEMETYKITAASDVAAMLGFEKLKDSMGCADSVCAAAIGGALGVDLMIVPTADVLGNTLIMTAALLDATTGQAVRRAQIRERYDEDRYYDAVNRLALEVLGSQSATPKVATPVAVLGAEGYFATESSKPHAVGLVVLLRNGRTACTEDALGDCALLADVGADAGSATQSGVAVDYRYRHGAYRSSRLRVGAADGDDFVRNAGSGLLLSLGQELSLPLLGSAAPFWSASEYPIHLFVALDAEGTFADTVHLQAIASAGIRLLWFSAQVGYGLRIPRTAEQSRAIWDIDRQQEVTRSGTFADSPHLLTYDLALNLAF
jgi:hypothetical protein